jgi:pimeloyl-CoA synthetase
LGYEFAQENEARIHAAELDRRFSKDELPGLRVYRIRWNDNYLVEAIFREGISKQRIDDARALLGESGVAIHPDDLVDYKRATEAGLSIGLPGWLKRFLGRG